MKMDFGHFGDGGQQTPAGTPNAGTPQGQGPFEEPVFMHNMEHGGITCDVCNSAIRGFRYKCMECADYDLCSGCERKGNHPGHVMMRIAFPEQARDAIRRFLGNVPGAAGFDARRAAEGLFGFQFPHHGGHHRGHHGHRFRGATAPGRNPESEGEGSSPERGPGDCPYGLGRKGMKKWAKCMKKMAYQQRRSAENYARAANAEAGASANSGSGGTQQEQGPPLDFTAAASQIQEFLNAFGIPIDVVELYDNFGNRGQPNEPAAGAAGNGQQSETGQSTENAGQSNEASGSGTVGAENSQSPPQTLAATLQQLHLNNVGQTQPTANEQNIVNAPSAPVTMELDADSSGWTLLERERTPPSSEMSEQASVPQSLYPSVPSVTTVPVVTLGADSSARGATTTPTSSGPTSVAGGAASYVPGISQPQLQQLLSGVSQAMNSVVRNIPIVTNPNPQEQQQEQGMDVKCSTTLKQLLAMGFSNQDGWLSRLVIAKKGDLEAVLNALFPAGQ